MRVPSDVPVWRNWYITVSNLYENLYINQFLETGTSDRTLMGLDQHLRCLGFMAYTPFHFSFTVTLRLIFYLFYDKKCILPFIKSSCVLFIP